MEGHIRIPQNFVRHAWQYLTPNEKNVIIAVASYYSTKDQSCKVGEAKLCAITQTSRTTLWRALSKLEARGFITIERGRPNHYRFTKLYYEIGPPPD